MLKVLFGMCAVFGLSGFGFINVEKGPQIGSHLASKIEAGHSISSVVEAIGRQGTLIAVEGEEYNQTRSYLWESETDSLRITTRFDKVVAKVYRGRSVKIASDARPPTFEEGRSASAEGFNSIPQSEFDEARNDKLGSQAAELGRLKR